MDRSLPQNKTDFGAHPCFNDKARHEYSRIHLPVAPGCNMQCNYCHRKFSCVNESRPGVTCAVLRPLEAVNYLREYASRAPKLSVVGIAGPGDPFANPVETMETLRLVKAEFPRLLLCVATNGLNLLPYVEELAAIGVSHVTVTVNAVDPWIGAEIYEWMNITGQRQSGVEAARHLWNQQAESIATLADLGVLVKINTIYIPSVNEGHIQEIARKVATLGASILNIMPLYPVERTAFAYLSEPSRPELEAVRKAASLHLPQMRHCQRCRADAAGMLGEAQSPEQINLLKIAMKSTTEMGGTTDGV